MTTLADLGMTPEVIEYYRDRRLIRQQFSPDGTKVIYNYTESCQFGRMWDPITLQCRGLIADVATGLVLARPFRKFFNYGEETGGKSKYPKTTHVTVTDKLDGSLGILYPRGDREDDGSPIFQIATRGSFESEQALHATWIWLAGYQGKIKVPENLTLLFEIIYPENRIVVNYNGRDDLVLLGAVDIETGRSYPPNSPRLDFWWGLRTETFKYATLKEALEVPPRENAEGLVVHFPKTDDRVKIKQEDYVAAHKIVTGLNRQVVWQAIQDEKEEELLALIPDEFHDWYSNVLNDLEVEFTEKYSRVLAISSEACGNDAVLTRKQFALFYQEYAEPWMLPALFHLLDNSTGAAEAAIWKTIKPSKEK